MAEPNDPQTLPAPQAPQVPQALQQPSPHVPPLNQSYFKPKFLGKPDDNAEVHLLRTNIWMDTHRFQEDDKIQRFCLTLTREARLWYESLRLINADWIELQNSLRQQYSKIGNTTEYLIRCRFLTLLNKS